MNQKTSLIEIKNVDSSQGVVEAFVNTMGVKDKDGDIIEPTAFDKSIQSSLPIPVLTGHDQHLVVGKVLEAESVDAGDGSYKLHATMQFNMDTEDGRDAFSNVSGDFVREWSVGFNIPDGSVSQVGRGKNSTRVIADLDWVETSMVVRGASPDTSTISAKAEKANKPIKTHSTETTSGPWKGSDSRRGITSGAEGLRGASAWVNPDGKPDAKSSYKFIHHHVEDGIVGAANIRACSGAIGVLNGGRGGSDIPKADREMVYKHLAKHIKDAGKTPPELRDGSRVWSRVRTANTDFWKVDLEDITEDEAEAIISALDDIEDSTDESEEEVLAVEENPEDAEHDTEETFSDDDAEELLANAERQLSLLNLMIRNKINTQEV